ncbi:GNAT family N-acetyltransferase [Microvirga lotononidis]|uniref:GNAT family N-acetyltransferase n=1 Tax=Microvirga lotononidis TaxID=864069 RepID=UPI000307EB41|nr:GNAT family N-acetyltransferase [Microvirga lotononidis]WQO30860.1 GNAT family N-acetyltransferase [Microvirga lotononidis]
MIEANFGWDEGFQRLNLARTCLEHRTTVYSLVSPFDGFSIIKEADDALILFLLCVDPQAQHQKIGTTAIEQMKREAAETGRRLTGTVLPGNDVGSFYTGLGFNIRFDQSGKRVLLYNA